MPSIPHGSDPEPEQLIALADDVYGIAASGDGAAIAGGVLAEVASRMQLFAGPPAPVVVQFDLGVAARRLGWQVTAGLHGASFTEGWAQAPAVTIRQDLVELVQLVYGPPGAVRAAGRQVFTRWADAGTSPADAEAGPGQQAALAAAHQVLSACDGYRGDLSALALHFGRDIAGGPWNADRYERHLAPLRDLRAHVLEIGGGRAPAAYRAALQTWKHYFSRGLVFGLAAARGAGLDEPRLQTLDGSRDDAKSLERCCREYGPFDLVVDSGRRGAERVFDVVFPYLQPGGLYLIEDLAAEAGAANLVSALIGSLAAPPRRGRPAARAEVKGVFAYSGVTFVEKGAAAV